MAGSDDGTRGSVPGHGSYCGACFRTLGATGGLLRLLFLVLRLLWSLRRCRPSACSFASVSRHIVRPEGVPVVLRYFDPSCFIPNCAASAEDSILCDLFARNAAHAATAGKTGLVIGFLHEKFIHVPIEMLCNRKKSMNPENHAWVSVVAAT